MLSCFYTTVGFYTNSMTLVWTIYVFMYGRIYLATTGLDEVLAPMFMNNGRLQHFISSEYLIPAGLVTAFPMLAQKVSEKGFINGVRDFVCIQLLLSPIFFTFSLGTRAHYYGKTLLHGGAEYRATGRGFVVVHAKFAENYRLYSRSHFVKAFELIALLVAYYIIGQSYRGAKTYMLTTCYIWFMGCSWLLAPFVFNLSAFEWQNILEDWVDWTRWIRSYGGVGVKQERSWKSWWDKELETLQHSGKRAILVEILLALRFLFFQYLLLHHLNKTKNLTKDKSSMGVFGLSWTLIFASLLVRKAGSSWRKKFRFSPESLLAVRIMEYIVCLSCIGGTVSLIVLHHMNFGDIVLGVLALMAAIWGLLQIANVTRPLLQRTWLWELITAFAQDYDNLMGVILFAPVAVIGLFPVLSVFQTWMLFNQAFGRGLRISRILRGYKENTNN